MTKMNRDFLRKCKTKIAVMTGVVAAFLAFATMWAAAVPFLPLHVHVGEKAPDFTLPSAEGGAVTLSQLTGHNVLLNFYEGYW